MFIAGSYAVYSSSLLASSLGNGAVNGSLGHGSLNAAKKGTGFRVADLLETRYNPNAPAELVPRKAACVIVSRGATGHPSDSSTSPIRSRELKFGVERILSDQLSTNKGISSSSSKVSQCQPSPSPPELCALPSCSTCLPRTCCLLPSCRCNSGSVLEPYPLYPYLGGQPLIAYPSAFFSGSELESRSLLGVHHPQTHSTATGGKRKRSWSRAVFSNLQRKGLEKRFQIQRYITKPDRRQLAATLGLTDAQVKVWFQNRRMKWRHSKEAREQLKAEKKSTEELNKNQNTGKDQTSTAVKENKTAASDERPFPIQ